MPILNQQVLATLDLQVLTIQRTAAESWWNFKNVISPYSRLWLVLDGHGVVRHHGREFKLKAGQLHLIPPFTRHDCSCSHRLDHYHLHFVSRLPTGIDLLSLLDFEFQVKAPADSIKHLRRLESLYPDNKLPCFDPSRDEYRRFPAMAEQASRRVLPLDCLEANAHLALLLNPFLKSSHEHEGIHTRATRLFLTVQEFIHAHMHEAILLGDLARVAGLHPTYFSDRFRELVGVRPLEYLMRRRIERAQYLLLASSSSVKEIAVKVGIPDAAYFARVFARMCGSSPSAYRVAYHS